MCTSISFNIDLFKTKQSELIINNATLNYMTVLSDIHFCDFLSLFFCLTFPLDGYDLFGMYLIIITDKARAKGAEGIQWWLFIITDTSRGKGKT